MYPERHKTIIQECIPVGCVPSAAVAVSGAGGGVHLPPLVDRMTGACEIITFSLADGKKF